RPVRDLVEDPGRWAERMHPPAPGVVRIAVADEAVLDLEVHGVEAEPAEEPEPPAQPRRDLRKRASRPNRFELVQPELAPAAALVRVVRPVVPLDVELAADDPPDLAARDDGARAEQRTRAQDRAVQIDDRRGERVLQPTGQAVDRDLRLAFAGPAAPDPAELGLMPRLARA